MTNELQAPQPGPCISARPDAQRPYRPDDFCSDQRCGLLGQCARVQAPEGDDREAFEAAYRDAYKFTCEVCHDKFERSASDDYEDVTVMVGWRMWRAARAAQPAPAACTCPSGDGSLRWPCPAHPAPAEGVRAFPVALEDAIGAYFDAGFAEGMGNLPGGASAALGRLRDEIRAYAAKPQPKGTAVAWARQQFIHDDGGFSIGTDDPELYWGEEPPDGESDWHPLYAAAGVTTRDAALEEAAQLCELWNTTPGRKLAGEIRALASQAPAPAQPDVTPGGMVLVPRDLLKDAAESVDDYRSGVEFGSCDRKLLGRLKAVAQLPDATAQSPAVGADDVRDAARYRHLRGLATQQADCLGPIFRIDVRRQRDGTPFNFSAAVDSSMVASKPPVQGSQP